MSDKRKDLPPVNAPNFLEKVREALSVYLGNRGDALDQGLTRRDLLDAGVLGSAITNKVNSGISGISLPGGGSGNTLPDLEPDLTPPPTPTGFTAVAAIVNLMVECDAQTYTQGHGHSRSVLYGAAGMLAQAATMTIASPCVVTLQRSPIENQRIKFTTTGALPSGLNNTTTYYTVNCSGFTCKLATVADGAPIGVSGGQSGVHTAAYTPIYSDTVELTQFAGTVYSYATNPATTWHLWLKWKSVDGVESTLPAGGINGVKVTTAENVAQLLDALTSQITESQLYADLGARINLIDSGPSSLLLQAQTQAAALLSEANTRSAANGVVNSAITATGLSSAANGAAIASEALSRSGADGAAASATTLLYAKTDSSAAAIQTEQTARATSESALASQVVNMVAVTGNSAAAITAEQGVRTSGDSAIASQATAMAASVGASAAAIQSEQTVRADADSAQSSNIVTYSAATGNNTAALKVETDTRTNNESALSSQVVTLASSTDNNTASLVSQQTTTTTATSALSSQILTLNSATGNATAGLVSEQTARSSESTSLASQVTTLTASVGSNTASISAESIVRADDDGKLFAQYTVKVDVAGLVSGFGLASTLKNATPTSAFGVRADQFYVAPPATSSATAPTANLYNGYCWLDTSTTPAVTKYRSGSSWVTTPPVFPFIVQATPTTINGKSVPAGVYMDAAYIESGTITNAKIGEAQVDDAHITTLRATKLTAGTIAVGEYIQSTGYVAGSAGWKINGGGVAEFSGVIVRGTVYASAGDIGGNVINSTGIQSPGYAAGTTGWRLDSDGTLHAKSGVFSGSLSGATITGATGSFSGSVNVGDFTGFAWPAAGGTGAHLSASGFGIGNPNASLGNPGGKYFLISTPTGGAPAITTNIPAYLEDLQVTTAKIGDHQVTFPLGVFSAAVVSASGAAVITAQELLGVVATGQKAIITFTALMFSSTHETMYLKLFRVDPSYMGPPPVLLQIGAGSGAYEWIIPGSVSFTYIDQPSAGTYNYVVMAGGTNNIGVSFRALTYLEAKK